MKGPPDGNNNVTYIPLAIMSCHEHKVGETKRHYELFCHFWWKLWIKKKTFNTIHSFFLSSIIWLLVPFRKPCERVLTRNVPQLEADQGFAVPVDHFECEVDADRGSVVLREQLVHVPLDDAGLPDAQLSDDQHFE